MSETAIEWTDSTRNPVAGCSIVSAAGNPCTKAGLSENVAPVKSRKVIRHGVLALQIRTEYLGLG